MRSGLDMNGTNLWYRRETTKVIQVLWQIEHGLSSLVIYGCNSHKSRLSWDSPCINCCVKRHKLGLCSKTSTYTPCPHEYISNINKVIICRDISQNNWYWEEAGDYQWSSYMYITHLLSQTCWWRWLSKQFREGICLYEDKYNTICLVQCGLRRTLYCSQQGAVLPHV